jgi:hypothetical protein
VARKRKAGSKTKAARSGKAGGTPRGIIKRRATPPPERAVFVWPERQIDALQVYPGHSDDVFPHQKGDSIKTGDQKLDTHSVFDWDTDAGPLIDPAHPHLEGRLPVGNDVRWVDASDPLDVPEKLTKVMSEDDRRAVLAARGWTCIYGCPGSVEVVSDQMQHYWNCPWWSNEGREETPF